MVSYPRALEGSAGGVEGANNVSATRIILATGGGVSTTSVRGYCMVYIGGAGVAAVGLPSPPPRLPPLPPPPSLMLHVTRNHSFLQAGLLNDSVGIKSIPNTLR